MSRYEQISVGQLRSPAVTTAAAGSRVALTLTPAEVAAATVAAQTLTIAGVAVGDVVIPAGNPIANATALVDVAVTAANTVSARFINPTAGALTPTTGTYVFLVIKNG